MQAIVEILSRLVSIPSANPMGRPLAEREYGEARLTDCLERIFQEMEVPHARQEAEPGRENIIGRLDGTFSGAPSGKVILLSAHQDTVPATGMAIPPYNPRVDRGKLYGRGACDVKGGMAAMLTAFARLCRERPAPPLKDGKHLHYNASGHNHQVALARAEPKYLCAKAGEVVAACPSGHQLNPAARRGEGHGPQAVLPAPTHKIVEPSHEHVVRQLYRHWKTPLRQS